jgi:hypothetical protein
LQPPPAIKNRIHSQNKFVLHCKTYYLCHVTNDKENKRVNINLRVTEETKKELLKMAEKDRRSLSDYIRLQLEKLAASDKKK